MTMHKKFLRWLTAMAPVLLIRSLDRRAVDSAFVRASNPITNAAEYRVMVRA